MYEFLDRLITIAMPRIRDFRGMSAARFDGRGNYSMGVKEQIIFPEIQYDTDRSAARHGHHHHHHGARQQARPGTAGSLQLPVPQVTKEVRTRMAKTNMIKRENRARASW